ncbi:MAG TPA: hypothetical protein VEB21_18770 [Terriglobales bacterium]|nr:hypothetical protein [Terriglobales bacterium]
MDSTGLSSVRAERDQDVLEYNPLQPMLGGESRSCELTGTRALMLAVLEDAIRSYLSGSKLAARDAEFWIQSHRRQSPFSFIVVCEVLGLDPDAVRTTLQKIKANNPSNRRGFPRARRNVRIPGRVCLRRSN